MTNFSGSAQPLPVYIYRSGRDFSPSEILCNQLIPGFTEQPLRNVHFVEVDHPDAAAFLIFPYFLTDFTEQHRVSGLFDFLQRLRFMAQREPDHVFFSNHDASVRYYSNAVWLRASVNRFDCDAACYAIPYITEDLGTIARQDFSTLRYHTSFVGYIGFCGERLPLLYQIANEKRLVSLVDPVQGFFGLLDRSQQEERRIRYLDALASSLTVLCPAGDGENSIRFFESLSAGRIPVLVSDALLPLEWLVPYQDFVMSVARIDQDHVSSKLLQLLTTLDDLTLLRMCHQARRTWEAYFAPEKIMTLIRLILDHHKQSPNRKITYRHDTAFADTLVRTAYKSIQQGNWLCAQKLLQQAIGANPRQAYLYNDLGVVLFQLGDYGGAQLAFQTGIRYDHRLFWGYVNLSDVLTLQEKHSEALASLRRAAAVESSHPLPYMKAAELYLINKDYVQALDCLRKAGERDVDDRYTKTRQKIAVQIQDEFRLSGNTSV